MTGTEYDGWPLKGWLAQKHETLQWKSQGSRKCVFKLLHFMSNQLWLISLLACMCADRHTYMYVLLTCTHTDGWRSHAAKSCFLGSDMVFSELWFPSCHTLEDQCRFITLELTALFHTAELACLNCAGVCQRLLKSLHVLVPVDKMAHEFIISVSACDHTGKL